MSFSTLGLTPEIQSALDAAGYREPTPIQAEAIPPILKGEDVIGIAQTGTGKTAAFTLPLLTLLHKRKAKDRGIRALILAPTRELVAQIQENVARYSSDIPLRCVSIYGGVGEKPQIEALKRGTEIVIATPGRLKDLIDQGHVDFRGLEFFVLDEADRMLDMGFLPEIRRLRKKLPRHRQTLLFSATLCGPVEALASEFQNDATLIEVGGRSNPSKDVQQSIHDVEKHLKTPLLLKLLEDPDLFSVLVFCGMKHQASRLAKVLTKAGVPADAIHGDRTQNQRQRALDKFKKADLRVLVATDVAARGIDISGVTHVINYDFPRQHEDYIHRIGRTGRAGAQGVAISFVQRDQRPELKKLQKFIGRDILVDELEDFDYDAPAPERPPQQPRGGGRGKPGAGSKRPANKKPGGRGRRRGR